MDEQRSRRRRWSRRLFLQGLAGVGVWSLGGCSRTPSTSSNVGSGPVEGDSVAERAINGAKALGVELELNVVAWGGFWQTFANLIPEFQAQTGIGARVIDTAYGDVPAKVLSEAVARSGKVDLFHVDYAVIPPAVGADLLQPLDAFMERGRPSVETDAVGSIGKIGVYEGRRYGFPNDGDSHGMYLRKDLMEDPDNQKRFSDLHGRPLSVPQTWDEYFDLSEFFHNPDEGLFGNLDYRTRKISFYWYLSQFYAEGVLPFADDMTPQLESDAGMRALQRFMRQKNSTTPEILNWGTPQILPAYRDGKAFAMVTWPGLVLSQLHSPQSKVKGKVIYTTIPGTIQDGQPFKRSVLALTSQLVLSKLGQNPEAAYWLIQWLTSSEISLRAVKDEKATFLDPWAKNHFEDPQTIELYTPGAMSMIKNNLEIAGPTIALPGSLEYHEVLDSNVLDAYQGHLEPEQALKNVQGAWEEITERAGRSAQQTHWKSLKALFPTQPVPDAELG